MLLFLLPIIQQSVPEIIPFHHLTFMVHLVHADTMMNARKTNKCSVGCRLAFSCIKYQKIEKLGENKFSA